jgi:hypothetical protein
MRDLNVFFDVVQSGSMTKAAAQLRVIDCWALRKQTRLGGAHASRAIVACFGDRKRRSDGEKHWRGYALRPHVSAILS